MSLRRCMNYGVTWTYWPLYSVITQTQSLEESATWRESAPINFRVSFNCSKISCGSQLTTSEAATVLVIIFM